MKYRVTAESPEGMPIASFGSFIVDAESVEAAIGLVRHIRLYGDWWPNINGWSAEPLRNSDANPRATLDRREIA
jgi:hypothetical protein